LAGNAQRFKIRIRWYDLLFGLIKDPILELKIKDGLLGKKLSFNLKPFILDNNFSKEFLMKNIILKSNLPNWVIELINNSELVLIDAYKRKYFLSANKKYRLTIDYDYIFYRLNAVENSFNEKKVDKDIVTLELKYAAEDDDFVQNISQDLPFRLTAGSKYVYGVDILEL